MRDFWKENCESGLDAYLSQAVSDESRYCHSFKQIPQVRRQTRDGPYAQAQQRLFDAAQIPVDILRYKHTNEDQKMLRSHANERKEAAKKMTQALLLRMNKTKPMEEQKAQDAGFADAPTEADTEMREESKQVEQQNDQDQLDHLMEDTYDIENKENNAKLQNNRVEQILNDNSRHMFDLIERKGLVACNKLTRQPLQINTAKEAFFALLNQDLQSLADEHDTQIEEVQRHFYAVSCNRARTIEILKKEQKRREAETERTNAERTLA